MRTLFALFVIAGLLLYGCAGQQQNTPQQTGGQAQNSPPAPAGGQATPQPAAPKQAGGEGIPPASSAPPVPPSPEVNNTLPPLEANKTQPPPPPSGPEAKEFTVEATKWQFSPSTLAVDRGDIVRITLVNKEGAHGIAIPEFGFDLKAGAGETRTGEFTADKAGEFAFSCNVYCGDGHGGMKGTLVVR